MFLLYAKDGVTFSCSYYQNWVITKVLNIVEVHQTMPLLFSTYEMTEFVIISLIIFLECLSTHPSLLTWKRTFVTFLSSGKFTSKFNRKRSCPAFFVLSIIKKKSFINNNGLWLGFPSPLCGRTKSLTTMVHSGCLLFTETRIKVNNLFT